MGKTWGRLYIQTRNHRKIVALSRAHPKLWMVFYPLLEMAFEADDDGKVYYTPSHPYTLGELAEEVRVAHSKLLPVLRTMHQLGLIVFRAIGSQNEQNFDKKTPIFLQFGSYSERQFISDVSTERTKRFKEKQRLMAQEKRSKNVPGTLPGTGLTETETETDTEPPTYPPKNGGAPGQSQGKARKSKRPKTKLPPFSAEFELFWQTYPNTKGGKEKAWQIWLAREKAGTLPPADYIMGSLKTLLSCPDWTKESGKFIPMATTFLRQGRWTDAEKWKRLLDKKRQSQPKADCPTCGGTGWDCFEKEGERWSRRCRCTTGKGGDHEHLVPQGAAAQSCP